MYRGFPHPGKIRLAPDGTFCYRLEMKRLFTFLLTVILLSQSGCYLADAFTQQVIEQHYFPEREAIESGEEAVRESE